MQIDQAYTEVFGQSIWTKKIRPKHLNNNSTIVFLHDALGSIDLWRNFPELLVEKTGCQAFLYDRLGHGKSGIKRNAKDERLFYHEALFVLPELLKKNHISNPILLGHSDGGTIAILYASKNRSKALILEAAHVMVEKLTVKGVLETAENSAEIISKLGKYHGSRAYDLFMQWKNLWSGEQMKSWNIEHVLSGIEAPVFIIQGEEDNYGSEVQLQKIEAGIKSDSEILMVANCGHIPHLEHPDLIVSEVKQFLDNHT